MIEYDQNGNEIVLHPQSSKGKFVYQYKKGGHVDMGYLRDDKGNVRYFDTPEEARRVGGNQPCWKVSKITKPKGK